MLNQDHIKIIKGICPKCGAPLQYTYGHPDYYRCPNYPKCNERLHSAETVVWLAQHYIEQLETERKSKDE